MKRLGIHILALNETKLDNSVPKELTKVSGYQQIRLDRTGHGGRISIYVRDSINFKPRDDIPIDGLELICIEIEPPKASHFLLMHGTNHLVTLLAPLISWKKHLPSWIGKERK